MAEREPSELDLRAAFDAYLEDAPTQVRPAELAHGLATTYPIGRSALGRSGFGQAPAFAWMLLLVALLLALVVGGLVAGGWRLGQADTDTAPQAVLRPTGIQMIYEPPETYDRVVVDGQGTYWASGPGRVVRFDPETGERAVWTVADDDIFAGSIVAPAANGGVWVGSATAGYRRFDGAAFRESIASPGRHVDDRDVDDRAWTVAPDGSFWLAAGRGGGVLRWDGSAWVSVHGAPGAEQVAFGRGGLSDLWVTDVEPWSGVTRAWHFDGQEWTSTVGEYAMLVTTSDGTPWLARGLGTYHRFDGYAWVDVAGPGFAAMSLAAGDDGSVWALSANDAPPVVARYDGTRWITSAEAEGRATGGLYVTPAGVFVPTTRGLMRLQGDRWEPAWRNAQPGPASVDAFAPVTRDEAWVVDARTLWHHTAGRWESVEVTEGTVPAGWDVASVAAGPDGTVWVGGSGGAAALVDGVWRPVAPTGAGIDVVDANGTAWTRVERGGLIAVSRDAAAPVRRLTYSCETYDTFAPAPDGSVYLAAESGLYRVHDDTCTWVDVLGNGRPYESYEVLGGPAGRLVADVNDTTMLFDGTRWTTIYEDGPSLNMDSPLYAFDRDGGLWRLQRWVPGAPLEWFDGTRWIAIDGNHPWRALPAVRNESITSIQITPDGTLWFVASFGIGRVPAGSP